MSETTKKLGRYSLIYGVDMNDKKFLRIYKTTDEDIRPDDLIYWHHSNNFLSYLKVLRYSMLRKIIQSKSVGDVKDEFHDISAGDRINKVLNPPGKKRRPIIVREKPREPVPEPEDKSYEGLRKAANDYWYSKGIYGRHQ